MLREGLWEELGEWSWEELWEGSWEGLWEGLGGSWEELGEGLSVMGGVWTPAPDNTNDKSCIFVNITPHTSPTSPGTPPLIPHTSHMPKSRLHKLNGGYEKWGKNGRGRREGCHRNKLTEGYKSYPSVVDEDVQG